MRKIWLVFWATLFLLSSSVGYTTITVTNTNNTPSKKCDQYCKNKGGAQSWGGTATKTKTAPTYGSSGTASFSVSYTGIRCTCQDKTTKQLEATGHDCYQVCCGAEGYTYYTFSGGNTTGKTEQGNIVDASGEYTCTCSNTSSNSSDTKQCSTTTPPPYN